MLFGNVVLVLTSFYPETGGQRTLIVRNYWQLVKQDKVKLCSFLRVTDNITSGNIQKLPSMLCACMHRFLCEQIRPS